MSKQAGKTNGLWRLVYLLIFMLSLRLLVLGFALSGRVSVLGVLIIVFSIYLFFGSAIKIFRSSEKYRRLVEGLPDLLFWLP